MRIFTFITFITFDPLPPTHFYSLPSNRACWLINPSSSRIKKPPLDNPQMLYFIKKIEYREGGFIILEKEGFINQQARLFTRVD